MDIRGLSGVLRSIDIYFLHVVGSLLFCVVHTVLGLLLSHALF